MRPLMLLLLILLTTTILPAEDATLLHACDALEGASISTGGNWPDTQLVVSDDPSFITEGSGSLRLSGTSPADATGNSYLSIDLVIPPSDFTGKVLRFDAGTSTPDQSEALYVRGYNSAGECALSWFSWSGLLSDQMQTFELYPAMARKGLTWEPEMVKTEAPIDVVKLRIYTGTHNPGAAFDLFVDNVRVEASTMRSFLDITEPKPLFPETVLVEAGEPQAVIITPEGEEWAAVAGEVAVAIEAATGAKLSVVTSDGMDEAAIAETNAIIIGSIVNNMALLYPYSHQLTFADGVYPGAGGYELRTVHDPWGTGRNILAIGGSDVAGARAALEALAPHLQPGETLVLPPLLEAKLTGLAEETWGSWFTADLDERWAEGVRRSCETHLERAGTRGLFSMAEGQGLRYALTGREEYARMYVWMIKRTYEWYLSSPGTYGGPWGMDSDFHISRNIPAWDNVEECPAVTDEERWEVTKILFRWVSELGPQKSARAGSTSVRFNHQTFPALGCLYAGQYFQRYYDTFEGEYWVEVADGTFQYQLNASKPHCDCNTYQWHTLNHTLTYCMARPDLSYFTSGNARLNAEYGIMMMNNLGYQVPNGDIGGWGPIGAELRILRMAEWFYREGLYQWALDRKAQIRPQPELSSFSMPPDHPAVEPAHLLGAQGWALDELWYNSFGGPDEVALESAIDKISFRESFDPDAGYLLLDGLTRGGHGHMDANAILQWTENGRVWLADVDYIKSLPKYHNSMLVLRDGQSAPLPGYCELQNLADFETVGASQTVLRNYAGVDWHRGVIQLKGRAFVVVDRLVAREPGDYSFRAVWRTLGNTELDGATWQVEQDGQHAAIVMTADTRCIVTPDEYTSKNWSSYPWVDDALVLSMQGIVDARLEPGEQVTMFTVLHASGEEPSPVQVRRLSREMIAITGLGDPVIVAAGDRDGRIVLPGAATMVGELVTMTPTHICAVGVTQAEALGQSETREGGADAEANIAAGTVQVRSPMAATVGATQTVEVMDLPMQATSAEVAGLMNMIIAAASPVGRPASVVGQLPELAEVWSYVDMPQDYLLTGNPGPPESVQAVEEVSVTPEPLEANVFSRTAGDNLLRSIFDGRDSGTSDAVMWDDGQEVTINLRLHDSYDLHGMNLRAWFATESSKDKLFQLARIRLLASDDGFAQDQRVLVDFTDEEMHGSWGAPGHAPQVYAFDGLDARAQELRLILTPRPGTAVYVAEVELRGSGEGLAELAAANADGRTGYVFDAAHCADLDGDGAEETLLGSSNGKVYCLGADGKVRWIADCGQPINSVTTVDFAGNDRPSVVAGTMNSLVVAISGDGEVQWTYEVPYYKRTPHVRTVFAADLGGEGREIAVAGADNWRYHAIDGAGHKLWHYESVHGSTAGAAADLDGDGRDEVIAGTEYYTWHVINADGSRRWGARTAGGPCANAAAAGDVDGDGTLEVIFGGADSNVHTWGDDGKLRWLFNTGDEVTGVVCADVAGDGADEILVSSLSFNVYCLDGDGALLWRSPLPNEAVSLALLQGDDGLRIAAGCSDGAVYLLDAGDGAIRGRFDAGAKVLALASRGGREIIATTADGRARAISAPE